MTAYGVEAVGFADGVDEASVREAADMAEAKGRVSVIMIETPSNPLNTMVDIKLVRRIADEIASRQQHRPIIVCDNTLLGPVFQRPLPLGADVSVYSLTKYVGGHSDLIAGAALGSERADEADRAAARRHRHAARSAFLLDDRPVARDAGAAHGARPTATPEIVAEFLRDHPRVAKVHYLPFLSADAPQRRVYEAQCTGAGSTFSFDIKGGEAEAFACLNAMQIFKLPSAWEERSRCLPSRPRRRTRAYPPRLRARIGVSDATIRLSIGIEHPDDLLADLSQALSTLD